MEVLKNRKVASLALASLLGLAACGNVGYSRSIGRCRGGDSADAQATMGSNDENDPAVLLSYARKINKDNSTSTEYHDGEAHQSVLTLKWSSDPINGIGEIACFADMKKEKLTFTSSGMEVRQDYINSQGQAAQR